MTKNAKLELLMGFYKAKGFDFSWNQVEVIQRAASAMQKLAEDLCNGFVEQDEYERREGMIFDRIKKSCGTVKGFGPSSVIVQGDPRGYCLRLKTASGDEISPHHYN